MPRLCCVAGWCALAALLLVGRLNAQDHVLFTDPAAENLFRYSRMAIGSGQSVAGLRSLVFKGRSRVMIDDSTLAPATVEIKLLLPDHDRGRHHAHAIVNCVQRARQDRDGAAIRRPAPRRGDSRCRFTS